MCRWPNGDLSFVSARNKEDAIIRLDEWDNAELAELTLTQDFMVDFRLADNGELELQSFGEATGEEIRTRAYPILADALINAPTDNTGTLTPAGEQMMRDAVNLERQRMVPKKRKSASTALGKSIQEQLGAPAALVNRYVKQSAKEILRKTPTSGPKH